MTDPQNPPGQAIRLVFAVADGEIRLVSRQPVDVVVPQADPVAGFQGERGFWVETRSATERTLFRRVLPDPYRADVEVFPEDPEGAITRVPVEDREILFTVLVPAAEEAEQVAVFSSEAPSAAMRADADVAGALEVARFDLRDGPR